MLNNRLLVNGQFGYRDNATNATPSFIGDFDIRYLLKRNGNIAVKFYNQTNDRYFTRTALNTQGIGLIIKKDFNGLSDLFSKKKKIGSEEKAEKEKAEKDKSAKNDSSKEKSAKDKADSKEKNDKSSKEKVSKAKSEPEAKAKTEPAKAPLIAKPKPDIAARPHSKPDAASPSHPAKSQNQPDYSEEPRGNNTSWIIFNQKI